MAVWVSVLRDSAFFKICINNKEKFWFYNTYDVKKLFKIGRPNKGENWSEKVAFELAKLLNIPCAKYEFAKWNDKLGTISTSFTDGKKFQPIMQRIIYGYHN